MRDSLLCKANAVRLERRPGGVMASGSQLDAMLGPSAGSAGYLYCLTVGAAFDPPIVSDGGEDWFDARQVLILAGGLFRMAAYGDAAACALVAARMCEIVALDD